MMYAFVTNMCGAVSGITRHPSKVPASPFQGNNQASRRGLMAAYSEANSASVSMIKQRPRSGSTASLHRLLIAVPSAISDKVRLGTQTIARF